MQKLIRQHLIVVVDQSQHLFDPFFFHDSFAHKQGSQSVSGQRGRGRHGFAVQQENFFSNSIVRHEQTAVGPGRGEVEHKLGKTHLLNRAGVGRRCFQKAIPGRGVR